MKTRVLVFAAAMVAACCWSQNLVIIKPPRIIQVVDEMTVLAWINENPMTMGCIVGVPTKELYEGGNVYANYGSKTLLIPAGVYRYQSVMKAPTQLRKLMWIHPSRIRKEVSKDQNYSTKRCGACGGDGRLSKQYDGEMGRRVCRKCGGSGVVPSSKKSKTTVIYIDGKPVKEIDGSHDHPLK